jgi:hypothetical protein
MYSIAKAAKTTSADDYPCYNNKGQKVSSQFPVLGSQFSALGSQFSVLGSRFSVLGSQFLVLGS